MSTLSPFFRSSDPRMKTPRRVGVRFVVIKAKLAHGRIALRQLFQVRTTEHGRTKYRAFSISKLGWPLAWKLAVRHREAWELKVKQIRVALKQRRAERRRRRVAAWLATKPAAYRQAHSRRYNQLHKAKLKQRRQQKRLLKKEGR